MRGIHRWMATALAVLMLPVACDLAGCAGARPPSARLTQTYTSPTTYHAGALSVAVIRSGWHTGLLLPVAALDARLADLREAFPHARYLVVGWGNRDFYTAANPGAAAALAALLPSASVVYVRGLAKAPAMALPADDTLRWLCLSSERARRLDAYLASYLQTDSAGHLLPVASGRIGDGRFFASTGTYDAFHTCNTWTAAALAFAGWPVRASGVLFAGQAMAAIRRLPRCPAHNQSDAARSSSVAAASLSIGAPKTRA